MHAGLGYKVSAQDEELLKQFDLNSKFGPCTGMSRQERCNACAFLLHSCLHFRARVSICVRCLDAGSSCMARASSKTSHAQL